MNFPLPHASVCHAGYGQVIRAPQFHAGMVATSLATLNAGGAFTEVGKRDIWSAARVAQVRTLHEVLHFLVAPKVLATSEARTLRLGYGILLSQCSRCSAKCFKESPPDLKGFCNGSLSLTAVGMNLSYPVRYF